MQTWKTISRKPLLNHSKYLNVEAHTIELPNGRIIENWPWVIKPDYVNVLAQTEEGHFLCFRQTKYAVKGTSLAPVGGYVEPGEEPLTAAKRELMEEMGLEASQWVSLGSFVVDANHGPGMGHLYLARNARKVKEANADDLEEQTLVRMTRTELETALTKGEFKVLAWATTIALGLRYFNVRSESVTR
jgi:ADP-ribose pyrophosphatase